MENPRKHPVNHDRSFLALCLCVQISYKDKRLVHHSISLWSTGKFPALQSNDLKMRTQYISDLVSIMLISRLDLTLAFWRLSCMGIAGIARIDPLISPGKQSGHVHTIKGASGMFRLNAVRSDFTLQNKLHSFAYGTKVSLLPRRSA